MKRDWTEIVKDKLSESTATPPDDLWAGISSQLDATMPPLPAYSKSKQWCWWTVAACLASALILYLMHNAQFTMHNSVEEPRFAEIDEADINGRGSNGMEFNDENPPNVTPNVDNHLAYNTPTTSTHDPQSVPIAQNSALELQPAESTDELTTDKSTNLDTDTFSSATCRQDTVSNVSTLTDHRLIAFEDRKIKAIQSKRNDGISIGLYASNTNMPSLNGISDMGNDFVLDDYPWSGSDVGSSNDGPQHTETPTYTLREAKHRQPLRFGLSVRLPVSSSISLSSGLVYSRLSSTMTWESAKGLTFETDQTLNYIGIPASIEYSLPSYQSAGFYLTAGAMVEKCIYGESKSTNSPLSKKVSENALQLSVFAGAGVQLNLNRHISIYAEPLATYYIDNHSDVVNIYKDRKLNLDLRVGLRYTLK